MTNDSATMTAATTSHCSPSNWFFTATSVTINENSL